MGEIEGLHTPHSAELLIRKIAADSAKVFFSSHAKVRMRERKVTDLQIIRCLQTGTVTEGPFRNIHGNWQVNVDAYHSGQNLKVGAVIDTDEKGNKIIVLTVMK